MKDCIFLYDKFVREYSKEIAGNTDEARSILNDYIIEILIKKRTKKRHRHVMYCRRKE